MLRASLFALLFLLAGCGSDAPADDHGDERAEAGAPDEITLTEAQAAEAAIETAAVTSGLATADLRVPARIVPTETGRAQVGALVDGRVVRLLAAEGQAVRRGAVVAEIESPEVARLEGEYLQAQARVTQARQQLERSRQLAAEDLISETLLEGAVADARATEAAAAALAGEVRAHGGPVPSGPAGVSGRVVVSSPISGVVSERQAELGAFVQAAAPLYEVIAPGQVYADASIDPALAASIGRGASAVIEAPGGQRYRGTVQFVGAEVADETRTATVRVRVTNATADLRPETFVTVVFSVGTATDSSQTALTVPATAVDRDGGRTYARREVVLGDATGERVAVTSGLEAGETVVTAGVFALKSFLRRGELSEHDH